MSNLSHIVQLYVIIIVFVSDFDFHFILWIPFTFLSALRRLQKASPTFDHPLTPHQCSYVSAKVYEILEFFHGRNISLISIGNQKGLFGLHQNPLQLCFSLQLFHPFLTSHIALVFYNITPGQHFPTWIRTKGMITGLDADGSQYRDNSISFR